jgi:hypothetical protein
MSFFTTSSHAAPKQIKKVAMGHQAFVASNLILKSGAIFIATSTSNNVAVLRILPETVMSAWETRGVLFGQ